MKMNAKAMPVPLLRLISCSLWMITVIIQGVSSADDRVLQVPNLEDTVCWSHFAGYLNATDGHQLFYWYHEAVTDPEEKPLVMWLNGGPGCSSLGGMFTELGPFVLDKDLKATLNPFSFNKVANILFIEQPAGVGFSYPNVPADDASTALDTDAALRSFLSAHPELQGRPFYVMGESYGGHYVPNTAKQIQTSNADISPDSPTYVNIKGFAVGNGYTDWQLDFNANVENARYHALTSQALLEKARTACDGDYARCFWPRDDVECPEACQEAVHEATRHGEDGTIDIYDIYNDVCLEDHQERLETQSTTFLKYRREARLKKMSSASTSRELRATISPVFPTCIDSFTQTYLNLPQVQEAIHVKPETVPNGEWSDCGNVDYDFNYESELDNYRQWADDGELEILIYNGDTDFILSHMGNSAWINEGLGLPKAQEWTPWRGSDGQVAGYFELYETSGTPLTFLTVKGAGHMVPRDRPRHALDMFEQFITGGPYDEVKKSREEPLCLATGGKGEL